MNKPMTCYKDKKLFCLCQGKSSFYYCIPSETNLRITYYCSIFCYDVSFFVHLHFKD